jgi:hypothetical protein
MEKQKIETFIKKYTLGGIINSVIWKNNADDLVVTAMTPDKKLFASVQYEKAATGFIDGQDVGILETDRLKKMLSFMNENVSLNLDVDDKDTTRVRKIKIDDGKMQEEYVTSEPSAIDPVPSMKNIPPFTLEIKLTPEFNEKFSKAFSALSDDGALFTVVMSKKTKKLDVVFGYKSTGNSDRIALGEYVTTTAGKDAIKNPISFTAKSMKEILAANSDIDDAILQICEAGLASVSFKKDGITSQYYLVKVDVED